MATKLEQLAELQMEFDVLKMNRRLDGPVWKSAWRSRDRWEGRWTKSYAGFFEREQRHIDIERVVRAVTKARTTDAAAAAAAIRMGMNEEQFQDGALKLYVGLAFDTGEDAGQFTLDALGLDKTFSWAGKRDFIRDPFAVRGSKVIQSMYGTHVDRLASMVVRATAPEKPKTIQQLTKEIKHEWDGLSLRQARVVARTETAAVWETTNFNAMAQNEVQQVDWIVATGPAIGKHSEPVCELCLGMAAMSPWTITDLVMTPPRHPNCRCTLVPVDDPEWLPPAEPWTGFADKPLFTFEEGKLRT